jgi:hypothetical protein
VKFRSFVAAAVVLAVATSAAQAVQLTVMSVATHATNSIIPAGQEVVTFGIQVTQSDLNGAGTNPVLLVQNLTFAGNGIVPINKTGSANKADVSGVQGVVDNAFVGPAPVQQSDLTASQQGTVYADSWWYNSGTGVLNGINDSAGDSGTITDPAFQLGPIGNVGTTGFVWNPNGALGVQAGTTVAAALASANGTNAATGNFMLYSGFYGPNGSNGLTSALLQSHFVNNVLTVPIAQIVTSGDIQFPGNNANAGGGSPGNVGSGTFLGVIGSGVSNGPTGNGTYNAIGGNPGVDPTLLANGGWHYSFDKQQIVGTPEPGTIILAGMGALGLALAWKRRK